MRGVCRSEPKFLAASVKERGVFWSRPKFLAIFLSLNAKRLSVGTEFPGNIYQFESES